MVKLFYVVVIILIILSWIMTGCRISETTNTIKETPIDPWYQETVDAIVALQPDIIPKHLWNTYAVKNGTEFDVNEYFNVLTHISVEDGYILDYIYDYRGNGGHPVFYFRHEGQPRYVTYQDLYYAEIREEIPAIPKIIIDDTKEGYFEYVVLDLIGPRFYIFWHSAYGNKQMICNPTLINEIDFHYYSRFSEEELEIIKDFEYEPVIEFFEDIVSVSVVIFMEFEGFKRITYKISGDYPHEILDKKEEVLLEFDPGYVL